MSDDLCTTCGIGYYLPRDNGSLTKTIIVCDHCNSPKGSAAKGPTRNFVVCPFCLEEDFDRVGLKIHLMAGNCDSFNTTSEHPKFP